MGKPPDLKIRVDGISASGLCTSGPDFGCMLGNELWSLNFGAELLGRIFAPFLSAKEAPRKIHPQEIHLPKFTPKNSTQKGGPKINIALLQGHLADKQ